MILACNTAAAVALRTRQQEWLPSRYPSNRILGVLVPTVEAITKLSSISLESRCSPRKPGYGQSVSNRCEPL